MSSQLETNKAYSAASRAHSEH